MRHSGYLATTFFQAKEILQEVLNENLGMVIWCKGGLASHAFNYYTVEGTSASLRKAVVATVQPFETLEFMGATQWGHRVQQQEKDLKNKQWRQQKIWVHISVSNPTWVEVISGNNCTVSINCFWGAENEVKMTCTWPFFFLFFSLHPTDADLCRIFNTIDFKWWFAIACLCLATLNFLCGLSSTRPTLLSFHNLRRLG